MKETMDEKYSERTLNKLAKWDEREWHETDCQLVTQCILHIINTYPLNYKQNNNAVL